MLPKSQKKPGRKEKVTAGVLKALELSPSGIASLDVLDSLGLANRKTLLATLCRLGKQRRIIRLKRGLYSTNPLRDAYAAAQGVFGGYIAFASALRLRGLLDEEPFTITVAVPEKSNTAKFGQYEFRAVTLKERAVGSERKGIYEVSTKAKTLFDCLFLPQYSVSETKLAECYAKAGMGSKDWKEFNGYLRLFGGKRAGKMKEFAKKIMEGKHGNA